ncbi:three component ABC system middle component [Methanobacterium formicicum]|uniref:Uncharacterized protein n=1 Tax=Methanobacterium formicicum (strain DSM 3637 / PP1) TaxID=1204725 RepID=K2R330_METFP|nr:three component ABC system middle component [Methanobacterium formicicum]EKF86938.1 hypothetical protein A994_01590 [Methanobacterium formicicum DSM 3637]
MKKWNERSSEAANLLNPAFCCVILTSSVIGYNTTKDEGFPLPLAFIVLPIILQAKTRIMLPRSTRTSLGAWIRENAHLRLSVQDRITPIKPYVQESILFGLLHEWLFLDENGRLKTQKTKTDVNKFLRELEGETRDCIKHSNLVGRWFAKAGSTETVMALWGVRP